MTAPPVPDSGGANRPAEIGCLFPRLVVGGDDPRHWANGDLIRPEPEPPHLIMKNLKIDIRAGREDYPDRAVYRRCGQLTERIGLAVSADRGVPGIRTTHSDGRSSGLLAHNLQGNLTFAF
jgi:hypothetical protein